MKKNIIVVDDFYRNIDGVREFALGLDYSVQGNYPGLRTESHIADGTKEVIESILGKKISYWPGEYNGAFQYTTEENKSWIHRDATDWAAILYMTPDAPLDGGTGFYRHKETGLEEYNDDTTDLQKEKMDNDSSDVSKWDLVDLTANKYNRLVIFNGRRSHTSMTYFGDNIKNGRLFQLFFFDTKNS